MNQHFDEKKNKGISTMTLSEELEELNNCGDSGKVLEGLPEKAKKLELEIASLQSYIDNVKKEMKDVALYFTSGGEVGGAIPVERATIKFTSFKPLYDAVSK